LGSPDQLISKFWGNVGLSAENPEIITVGSDDQRPVVVRIQRRHMVAPIKRTKKADLKGALIPFSRE